MTLSDSKIFNDTEFCTASVTAGLLVVILYFICIFLLLLPTWRIKLMINFHFTSASGFLNFCTKIVSSSSSVNSERRSLTSKFSS